MRRFLIAFFTLCVVLAPLGPHGHAMTDEEKKKAFLRAREEMKTVPPDEESTPKPKPKPKKSSSSPAPEKPKVTPEEETTPKPKPASSETPEKKKTTSKKSESPAKAHHEKVREEPSRTPLPIPSPTPAPTPTPRSQPAPTAPSAPVTIEKSGVDETTGYEPPPVPASKRHWWQFSNPTQYRYITRAVRDAIDRAPVARHRWRYIVVHNSGTRQGNAKIFDYYHRHTRKMPNGLAYHFVIGNGTSSGNGQIEIGDRWKRQINGGHVHSDYLNNIALGICLVGDFNRDRPTQQQLDALDELIRYLRERVGKIDRKNAIVKAHKDINPPQWPTDCPGDKFPYSWLYGRFRD